MGGGRGTLWHARTHFSLDDVENKGKQNEASHHILEDERVVRLFHSRPRHFKSAVAVLVVHLVFVRPHLCSCNSIVCAGRAAREPCIAPNAGTLSGTHSAPQAHLFPLPTCWHCQRWCDRCSSAPHSFLHFGASHHDSDHGASAASLGAFNLGRAGKISSVGWYTHIHIHVDTQTHTW